MIRKAEACDGIQSVEIFFFPLGHVYFPHEKYINLGSNAIKLSPSNKITLVRHFFTIIIHQISVV